MSKKTIKDINEYKGSTVNPMNYPNTVFELYSVPSFEQNYPEIIKGSEIGSSKVTVQENDVLVCKINPRINRVWKVKHNTEHQLLASSEWIIIRSPQNNADYLKWYFQSPVFRNYMNSALTGIGGSLTRAQPKQVANYPVPLPPLETQKQIAANLDKATQTIDLCNAILEKLDLLVKARFVEMFGDPDCLTEHWDVKLFTEVTICFDNTRKPLKDADRKMIQGKFPYYGATGIVDYLNDYRIDGVFLLISEDGKALEFRNKDIAFIAKGKIWVNNHAHVFQCKDCVNMIFLMFYMNRREISAWVTGIDQKKLNRENLSKMPLGIPPLELQTQFAAFVEKTDRTKAAVKQVLAKAETLKKALMQEYFG